MDNLNNLVDSEEKQVYEETDNNKQKSYCEKYVCGTKQMAGCYSCCNCGQKVYLDEEKVLPPCPRCTNETFTKEC